ncbi:hypothetical protein [Micromonospora sagamiensis]|uniref:hypothetical protein n=1 Tax=Micromonospora sagamiensis TaxID=47875 RepID=UPI0011A01246|nr:hypothetical protein [Micromonospora sagamiensis]BCL12648.1 hypothetical protein GCM10017556_03870 [Micromonospora sagamiensis]
MVEDQVERGPGGLWRLLAGVLAGVATVAVVTVLVAAYNPWHYVHLIPFGQTPVVVYVLLFSPIMLGFAVRLLLGKMRVVWTVGVVATLTVFTCVAGYQIITLESLQEVKPDARRTVVAVSPDGAFDLVEISYVHWGAQYEIFRIRSLAGLTSREAAQDLACFGMTIGGYRPENTFVGARFVGEHKVEVRTEAEPWTTTFDPNTLMAAETVSHGCK